MMRCMIPVTIDGEVVARFALASDAALFAEHASAAYHKTVTYTLDAGRTSASFTEGQRDY